MKRKRKRVLPSSPYFYELTSTLESVVICEDEKEKNKILNLITEYVGPAPVPPSARFEAMLFSRKQAEYEHWFTKTNFIHLQIFIWLALIICQVIFVVVLADEAKESFIIGRWLFLRLVGLNFLFAFVSFWRQFSGLAGSNGISPASENLESTRQICQSNELSKWSYFPSVYWFGSSDRFIHGTLFVAVILSVFVTLPLPFISTPIFLILTFLYQSIKLIGGDFMCFQWDSLLTETGFLAAMVEWQALFSLGSTYHPWSFDGWSMRLIVVSINSLHFRIIYTSGICKLSSNCYFWRSGTAMKLHYWTQPLPHIGGYYFNKLNNLPYMGALQNHATLCLEVAAPFLVLVPVREVRIIGGLLNFMLMLLIFLTGNYGFFNSLTASLFPLMVDDEMWPSVMKNWIFGFNMKQIRIYDIITPVILPVYKLGWKQFNITDIIALVPCCIYFVCALLVAFCLNRKSFRNEAISSWKLTKRFLMRVQMMGLFGNYGLFASMTAYRHEIQIEGTDDGKEWKVYEFKYKPGDLNRAPVFVPWFHMPRLDWQMWFLPLGRYNQKRCMWYLQFMSALVHNQKPVLRLLKHNPFPDKPPSVVRGWLYDYRFSGDELGFGSGTTEEDNSQWECGGWWSRRNLGTTFGPMIRKPRA